jgi:hypothetical protein
MKTWLLAAVALAALSSCSTDARRDSRDALAEIADDTPPRIGQWIWTRNDAHAFTAARAARPELEAAVFTGSLDVGPNGALVRRRALSPLVAGARVTAVVRLEDGVHALWALRGEDALGRDLSHELEAWRAEIAATGADVREVQLDYDAPVARLGAWARVVESLAHGPLSGLDVWVTSLPAHVANADYGDQFRSAAVGHVLQLFDTGLPCTDANVNRMALALSHQRMRYRIGLGAFERAKGGRRTTDHACFRRALARLRVPGYAGVWLFAAGRDPAPALSELSERGS